MSAVATDALDVLHARIDKRKEEIDALTNRLAEVELLLSLWAMAHKPTSADGVNDA